MSLYCIPAVVASALIFVPLCFTVKFFRNGLKPKLLTLFLLESLCCMVFEYFVINARSPEQCLFWDRMMYGPIVLLPCSLLCIIRQYDHGFTIKDVLLIHLPAIFFIVLLPTPHFLTGVTKEYWGWGKVVGSAYIYFKVYFLVYLSYFLFQTIRSYIQETDLKIKNEIAVLCLAVWPSVLMGIGIICIFPIFNIRLLNIMGVAFTLTYLSCVMTYAILSKRLFDIHSKVPVFGRRKNRFQHRLKLTRRKPIMSYEAIITELSDVFQCNTAIHVLADGRIYANRDCDEAFVQFHDWGLFAGGSEIILVSEVDDPRVRQVMQWHGIEAVMPLFEQNRVTAIIKFGEGFLNQVYSWQDMNLIGALCRQLEVAMHFIRHLRNSLEEANGKIMKLTGTVERIKAQINKPVLIFKSGGEICSIRSTGPVNVVYVDCDAKEIVPIRSEGVV